MNKKQIIERIIEMLGKGNFLKFAQPLRKQMSLPDLKATLKAIETLQKVGHENRLTAMMISYTVLKGKLQTSTMTEARKRARVFIKKFGGE